MSSRISPLSEPITLATVKIQFTQWRATRIKGERIPNTLWEAVLSLTKKYSYKKVASELNLNPHRLRTKMEKQTQRVPSSSPQSPDFIELPFSSLSPSYPQKPSLEQKKLVPDRGGTLEFTRIDGTLLKVSGLNHSDLCSLIRDFLGQ